MTLIITLIGYFLAWLIVILLTQRFSLTFFYLGLAILLLILFLIYLLQNPTLALYPYNFLLENIYQKKVFYTDQEKKEIFPSSILLEKNWQKIKQEFLNLKIQKGNIGQKFIQESDQFWDGWDTYTLRSFSKDQNLEKCPTLAKILKDDPNITSAFFSILKPGKTIPSHYGPFKGILRYHLGLIIPKGCFISVDNQVYEWKEGEGILFDETYKHFVKNESNYYRVILFIDVKRPLYFPLLNDFLLYLMKISTYN